MLTTGRRAVPVLRRALKGSVKAGAPLQLSIYEGQRLCQLGQPQHGRLEVTITPKGWHGASAPFSTAAAFVMPPPPSRVVPFKLADIGEGIAEVEMMQWFVKEGDTVKQFDRLCEVQSDKATVEISSRYDGVIKTIHHSVGSIAKVGSALVDIELLEEEAAALPTINNRGPAPPLPQQQAVMVAPPPPLTVVPPSSFAVSSPYEDGKDIVLTTPAVRRLAKENRIDLSKVRGTGPQGRVLKGDVLNFIKHGDGQVLGHLMMPPPSPTLAAATPQSSSPPPPPASPPLAALPTAAGVALATPPPVNTAATPMMAQPTRVPVRGVMRQMVKSMTASLKIPHFGYQDEVIMDELINLRHALKHVAKAQGIKMSYLPIMVKAASLALLHYPILNSSLSPDEQELIYHSDHNIGVAMDTSKGLLVPVVKRVQDKCIMQIAKELTELQALGASGSFQEEHLTGATFSLSNIGSIGGTYMDPKIVPPQVAIGAFGKIQKLPRFAEDGSVVPTHVMAISWSGDHRVIDGATMARFSNLWKGYLETPSVMLASTR